MGSKSSGPTCSSAMSSAPAKTMRKAVGSKIFPENSSKSATFSSTGKNRQKIAARRQKIAARLAAPAKARRKRGWKPLNEQQASSWHGLCEDPVLHPVELPAQQTTAP